MKVLITGSSGIIGGILLRGLANEFDLYGLDIRRESDGSTLRVDVADLEQLHREVSGISDLHCIVHLAGASTASQNWENILRSNIVGTRNVFEVARRCGMRRIVFASTNHVTGGYESSPHQQLVVPPPESIGACIPVRPNSDYATSKIFGEAMARQYYDLHGIEAICLRIGNVSSGDNPTRAKRTRRTWLSHRDLVELMRRSILADVGFGIYYGVSANRERMWDLAPARRDLGYVSRDDAATYPRSGYELSTRLQIATKKLVRRVMQRTVRRWLLRYRDVRGARLLYLASAHDKTIAGYACDADSGMLTKAFEVDLPGNVGPLAFSSDASFVYAALTGLQGGKAGVATLKRTADGWLKLLATAPISSRAVYIRTDKNGRNLLAAHYAAGEVTVYRIVDGICTDKLLDQKTTERTAHCIEVDPSGRFVFVPHTVPNKVYQFILDERTGTLTPNDSPFVVGPDEEHRYHGPRHYVHHPTLDVAYTSNELAGGITAWKFDPDAGTLDQLQTLSTLPPDYQGESNAADIHITPDGRFAYVSNRDVTTREKGAAMRDTLACVSLDARSGKMMIVGHFPTAHVPRSFCIDPTGRFAYVAGERSASLCAYRIHQETGRLDRLATYDTGKTPVWVVCGPVPSKDSNA